MSKAIDQDALEDSIRAMAVSDPLWLLSVLRAASNKELIDAAKKVVEEVYGEGRGWEELKAAIGELSDVLVRQGVHRR